HQRGPTRARARNQDGSDRGGRVAGAGLRPADPDPGAPACHLALATARLASHTHAPAMVDQPVREEGPVLRREPPPGHARAALGRGGAWASRRGRLRRRFTCVSTKMAGCPNAVPRTTLAVLRPIPGSATRASMLSGTSLPCSSAMAWATRWMARVFWRKKPVGLIIASTPAESAAASRAAE